MLDLVMHSLEACKHGELVLLISDVASDIEIDSGSDRQRQQLPERRDHSVFLQCISITFYRAFR